MNTQAQTRGSLTGVLVPEVTLSKDIALIGAGAALTAVAAQIQVPWAPVPFTLQTLVVALCGLTLGARRGALSQLAYLTAGAAGLPIFAAGKFGPAALFGPTGGYLVAFIAVAWLLGLVADKGLDRKVLPMAAAMVTANVVLFGLGTLWLSAFVGGEKAVALGVAPFIIPELLKDAIAVGLLPCAWLALRRK